MWGVDRDRRFESLRTGAVEWIFLELVRIGISISMDEITGRGFGGSGSGLSRLTRGLEVVLLLARGRTDDEEGYIICVVRIVEPDLRNEC